MDGGTSCRLGRRTELALTMATHDGRLEFMAAPPGGRYAGLVHVRLAQNLDIRGTVNGIPWYELADYPGVRLQVALQTGKPLFDG